VIKVKSRRSSKLYALKVVAKKLIESSHMNEQLINEVNIMSKLSHPRIIQMHTIFEDQKNIYFVLELADDVYTV
jgi:serine/threonine protein kinase